MFAMKGYKNGNYPGWRVTLEQASSHVRRIGEDAGVGAFVTGEGLS